MELLHGIKYSRVLEVSVNDKKLETPAFFPSISTHGLKMPLEYITGLVKQYKFPRILVSCYDIHHHPNEFEFLHKFENISFFDSGLYESFWLKDTNWKFDYYQSVLSEYAPDFYTSFDYIPTEEVESSQYFDKTVDLIIKSDFKSGAFFLPVLHPYVKNNVLTMTDKLVDNYSGDYNGISISENDLGRDIISVIKNIKTVKKLLSKKKKPILLHILGCGHPLNMLIYSSLGVDIFDSRSWSNSIINGDNLMMYPTSYLEGIDCSCDICKQQELDYITKSLLHNVISYEKITNNIKKWIKNDEIYDMIEYYIYNEKILKEIRKEV